MSVSVPHDGQGLANLYGGRAALGEKLDTIFETNGGLLGIWSGRKYRWYP